MRIMRVRFRAVTFWRSWLLAGVLGCSLNTEAAPSVGSGSGKDFKLPEYDAQGRLKSQINGKGFKQLPNRQMLITTLHLETYREDGQVEMIVEAPECLYDSEQRIATSAGEMKARQADGKYVITGTGFQWQQTNSVLIISNRAHTIISKELLKPKTSPATNPAAALRQELEVFADQFDFNSKAGVAVYRGHVRASDPQMKLKSEELTVKTAVTGGGVESIVARQDVVIEQGDTRATGTQAVYITSAAEDTIEITGRAEWHSPGHEGRGDTLILDRKRNEFRARGKAHAKLSPAAAKAAGAPAAAPAPAGFPAAGNQPVDIFAELLTVQLPPAGGPVQHVVAEQDVVILQGESRATGARAVYRAAATNEWVELTGNPAFRTPRFEGKGETLKWNRLDGEFQVRRAGYLKLTREGAGPTATNRVVEVFSDDYDFKPGLADFRGRVRLNDPEWKLAAQTVALQLSTPGNQIQKIVARREVVVEQIENHSAGGKTPPWRLTAEEVTALMAPTGNQITNILARQNVVVEQLESRVAAGQNPTWKLTSEDVAVKLSAPGNRIEQLEARQKVVVKQTEARAAGAGGTPWKLTCEAVNLRLSATGNEIENIIAEKNVVVSQLETRAGGKNTAPWNLQCAQATVRLSPKDHQITDIVAERQVIIRQGDSQATSARAVFTGTNSIVELTGNPVLLLVPATAKPASKVPQQLRVTGADVLLWDRANNKFKAKGDYQVAEPKGDVLTPK